MLTEIKSMVADIKLHFDEAKIKENHIDLPYEECESLPADMIREGYKWIQEIHKNEYAAVRMVKRLLPKELWDRYKAWDGFNDHQEVVLLREKMIPFRKKLVSRDRPKLFKKGEVNGQLKKISREKRAKSSTTKDCA